MGGVAGKKKLGSRALLRVRSRRRARATEEGSLARGEESALAECYLRKKASQSEEIAIKDPTFTHPSAVVAKKS